MTGKLKKNVTSNEVEVSLAGVVVSSEKGHVKLVQTAQKIDFD